jgi:Rrf2 family protein
MMTNPIVVVGKAPSGSIRDVRISSKADYAVRAALVLAAAGEPLNAETISERQGIPRPFLKKILNELQRGHVVVSSRGREGGHRLARGADAISVADVLRAVEGPLANVRGAPPEDTAYSGDAERLQDVWIALRTNVREVLEQVTLADLVEDRLPEPIATLASRPDSWVTR